MGIIERGLKNIFPEQITRQESLTPTEQVALLPFAMVPSAHSAPQGWGMLTRFHRQIEVPDIPDYLLAVNNLQGRGMLRDEEITHKGVGYQVKRITSLGKKVMESVRKQPGAFKDEITVSVRVPKTA